MSGLSDEEFMAAFNNWAHDNTIADVYTANAVPVHTHGDTLREFFLRAYRAGFDLGVENGDR